MVSDHSVHRLRNKIQYQIQVHLILLLVMDDEIGITSSYDVYNRHNAFLTLNGIRDYITTM